MAPQRLVLLFSPNGSIHDNWIPSGSEHDFQLNTIMEPLAPYKDKLIIPGGLRVNMSTHPETGELFTDAHITGLLGLWTGSHVSQGSNQIPDTHWAMGASIDQAIAKVIGTKTPFPSLELGARIEPFDSIGPWSRMIFSAPNQPVHPEEDPRLSFERLFGNLSESDAERERRIQRKSSVIDYLVDDLGRVRGSIGSSDRNKIDAHLDGMRALENQLGAAAQCSDPGDPSFGADVPHDTHAYPEVCRRMIEQLVMALSCDLTRVASLQFNNAGSLTSFPYLEGVVAEGHHTIGHRPFEDPLMVPSMTTIAQFYTGLLAYMMELMSQIPEGNGTMLDNTLIVYGNELANGYYHSLHPMPFLLAGGAGGALTMGRYLEYGDVEHNRLLTSIGQLFGLPLETFGDNDHGSGVLPGLI